MAMIIYSPNYSINTISKNFANKSSQTSLSTFISNNFTVGTPSLANIVTTTGTPAPVDMNLVGQVLIDYGAGPVSVGMNECLVIINNNVQVGSFSNGDIFNNEVIAGGMTDFRYVTDQVGSGIVLANLQMNTLLPLAPSSYQTVYNAVVLNIVRDLRNGVYDPNNYLSTIQYQSRQIAQILVNNYG
jgi:hypothetical protein